LTRHHYVNGYTSQNRYILGAMTKHLIDVDEQTLSAARAELGTSTIKETVHEALLAATSGRRGRITAALDVLAEARLDDREDAWR
jgi:Arc/MetJ family transcription regulator